MLWKSTCNRAAVKVISENSKNLALALEVQLGKGGLTEVTEMRFCKPAVRA